MTQFIGDARFTPRNFNNSISMSGNSVDLRLVPIQNTPYLVGTTTDFTMATWVFLHPKTTAANNDNHGLLTMDFSYAASDGYTLHIGPNNVLTMFCGGGGFNMGAANTVPFGKWVHVAYVISGTTWTGYVNGQLVGSMTIARRPTPGTHGTYICTEGVGTGAARRMYGKMAEFIFTRSALTQEQIQHIMVGAYPPIDVLYTFSEGTGTSVGDSSGNLLGANFNITPSWSHAPSVARTNTTRAAVTGSTTRINLITDPSLEFNTNSSPSSSFWRNGVYNVGTATYHSRAMEQVLFGTYSAYFQYVNGGGYYLQGPVTAFAPAYGQTYTFSAYVYLDPANTSGGSVQIKLADFNSYNTIALASTAVIGQWVRISTTCVITPQGFPSGVRLIVAGTGTVGYWIDGLLFEQSDKLGTYFDGRTNGGAWTGAVDASTSTLSTPIVRPLV